MDRKQLEQDYVDSYYTSDRRERSLPIVGCAVVAMAVVALVWLGVWVVGLVF